MRVVRKRNCCVKIDPIYKIEAWCWLLVGFVLGIIFMFVVRM